MCSLRPLHVMMEILSFSRGLLRLSPQQPPEKRQTQYLSLKSRNCAMMPQQCHKVTTTMPHVALSLNRCGNVVAAFWRRFLHGR